jgi:hypothetical protein
MMMHRLVALPAAECQAAWVEWAECTKQPNPNRLQQKSVPDFRDAFLFTRYFSY